MSDTLLEAKASHAPVYCFSAVFSLLLHPDGIFLQLNVVMFYVMCVYQSIK